MVTITQEGCIGKSVLSAGQEAPIALTWQDQVIQVRIYLTLQQASCSGLGSQAPQQQKNMNPGISV